MLTDLDLQEGCALQTLEDCLAMPECETTARVALLARFCEVSLAVFDLLQEKGKRTRRTTRTWMPREYSARQQEEDSLLAQGSGMFNGQPSIIFRSKQLAEDANQEAPWDDSDCDSDEDEDDTFASPGALAARPSQEQKAPSTARGQEPQRQRQRQGQGQRKQKNSLSVPGLRGTSFSFSIEEGRFRVESNSSSSSSSNNLRSGGFTSISDAIGSPPAARKTPLQRELWRILSRCRAAAAEGVMLLRQMHARDLVEPVTVAPLLELQAGALERGVDGHPDLEVASPSCLLLCSV